MSLAVYRLRSNDIVAVTSRHGFSGRATGDGFYVVLQLLRLHVCMHIPRALADPKRATRADVEATGGLSRAVMDVGRLKFCEIPGFPCCRRYFKPAPRSPSLVPTFISRVENARH